MKTTGFAEPVAITGVGLVSPCGVGVAPFHDALASGQSALTRAPALAALSGLLAGGAAPLCGQVADTGARAVVPATRLRRTPRVAQLGLVAAHQALGGPAQGSPCAVVSRYGEDRVGVVLGTGLGNLEQTAEFTLGYLRGGPEDASPAAFPLTVMNATAGMLAMEFQLRGLNITVNHRDLSLGEALASARDQLLLGRADAIVAGGFEELGPWTLHSYLRFAALAAHGARPYDRARDGLNPGEGAAVLLLERADDARARGATIYGYLAGVGRGGDDRPRVGYARPGEPPAVTGAVTAIQRALAEAALDPRELTYIAGGGDGGAVERLETAALRAALGVAADQAPISSVLGLCGQSMASAGLRVIAALRALASGVAPGTTGCLDPDPDASLPGLLLRPQPLRTDGSGRGAALVPILAMGGGNVALILTRD